MKGYCTYGATSIDLQINFKKFRIQALKELEVKICQKTLYMKKKIFPFCICGSPQSQKNIPSPKNYPQTSAQLPEI